jgi:putative flippase GtrA
VISQSAELFRQNQFARFLVVGGLAAMVNVVSRYLFNWFMGYSAAIVLAYLCGMVTAFLLSKQFVFATSGLRTHTEFIRFGLVNLAAVVQVWTISVGLAEWLFPIVGIEVYRYDIAHVIGVVVPAVTSYIGHKHYSFAAPSDGRGASHGARPPR